MDVTGFQCESLGSSTVELHDSPGSRRNVQRLVSVVKMRTVLEVCYTEEQRYVVSFFVGRRTQCKAYSEICFLFTPGNVCRVKRFTAGSRTWQTFRC
jgi:hypothetical protein